jgi:hypothetical protein
MEKWISFARMQKTAPLVAQLAEPRSKWSPQFVITMRIGMAVDIRAG